MSWVQRPRLYSSKIHSRFTHDFSRLLTILELLDVPFRPFISIKDVFGRSYARLLTSTRDYSGSGCTPAPIGLPNPHTAKQREVIIKHSRLLTIKAIV